MRRFLSQALVAVALLLPANIASGVTRGDLVEQDTDDTQAVTTGAAVRANADVQIRRVKGLLFSKSSEKVQDQAFERLQKLQKELRGSK